MERETLSYEDIERLIGPPPHGSKMPEEYTKIMKPEVSGDPINWIVNLNDCNNNLCVWKRDSDMCEWVCACQILVLIKNIKDFILNNDLCL